MYVVLGNVEYIVDMNSDDYIALRDRVRMLRPKSQARPPAETPPGVKLLLDLLRNAVCDDDYIAIAGLLAGEYAVYGMHDDQEKLLADEIHRFPEKPIPQIALANFLATVKEDLKHAKEAADLAIRKALKDQNFVRDSYNCRAQIAANMREYGSLEEIIVKLIQYRPRPGSMNVRYEDYFLANLPEGAIDPAILEEYSQLVSRPS